MSKTTQAKLTAKREKAVTARLAEGYEVETLKMAIAGCARSEYRIGKNDRGTRYDDLELICREGEKLEQFAHNLGVVTPTNKTFDMGGFLNEKFAEATDGQIMGGSTIRQIESDLP